MNLSFTILEREIYTYSIQFIVISMLPAHIHNVTNNIYMLMVVCSGMALYCPDGSHNDCSCEK